MKLFGGPRYPEEVAARVPPGQRLVKGWPVLHYGPIPRFDEAMWDFKVFGEVESPYQLSYAELKARVHHQCIVAARSARRLRDGL